VRSIDRDVVSLILWAEDDANPGNNSTGGGVFPFGAPSLPEIPIGYLKVNIEPPCAVAAGAKWSVEGDTNLFPTSGPVAAIAYTYSIEFSGVPGFIAPASKTVTLTDGQTNVLAARYLGDAGLQVNLEPGSAVNAGARWFIVGETKSRPSGRVIKRAPCQYEVDFVPVPGFTKPATQQVTLTNGRTNVLNLTYQPLPFALQLTWEGLSLVGPTGVTYHMQMKPDLMPDTVWSNLTTITLSNRTTLIPTVFPTNRQPLLPRRARALREAP
jgi:hypothetical protein